MIHSSPSTWGKLQIMTFLKELFKSQPSGNFVYLDDESATEIMIVSKNEVSYSTIGSTPVIAVDENSVNPDNRVIGYLSDINYETGEKKYIDTYHQTLVMSCVSSVQAESVRIADIVFNGFKYNHDYIMNMGFQQIVPNVVGDTQIVMGSSDVELASTQVPVSVVYTVEWSSMDNNPILLGSVDLISNS